MRPLKLTLQAFGSYPDKIEIPFENLGSSNLFLISGVTGSGKTTIFDAICFALFNTSSGSNKGNANFRSHFADEKTLSFVEFEFLFNGEKYTVTRSPSYERKKLRNEGYIQESSKAQLMLPNSKLIIGVKEVDEYIIDLLGINASQFSQIALLAQGEFIKLLNCSTQERGEIFRNIFQTNDFQAFQLKLKDRMLEFKTDYENIKSSILQYINQVETNDEKINSLKENYKEKNIFDDLNIFIELLEKETKIQDKKIKENNRILEEINKKELELKNKLEKIKIKNDLIKTQKNIEINLENQLKEYVEIKKEFENLDKKNNELQNLSFQIKKLEEDYQKIKELETLIDKESKIKKEINLIQEEITLKQIKSAKILSIELDKSSLITENYTAQKMFDNLKQELNNNQEYFKNKDINVKNLSITYEKNYHEYLSSQAGILALNLKEDIPCPVCGSLKHPNKAKTSLDIVSQEDLNNLKETLENEKNILNDLSKNCSILIENINTKEKNYLNFVKENNIKNDDIKEIKTDKTFEELLEEILNKKDILSKLNNELIEQNTKLELIKKDLKNQFDNYGELTIRDEKVVPCCSANYIHISFNISVIN